MPVLTPDHAVLERFSPHARRGRCRDRRSRRPARTRAVGELDGLGFRLELEERGHRSKRFLAGDDHIEGNAAPSTVVRRPASDRIVAVRRRGSSRPSTPHPGCDSRPSPTAFSSMSGPWVDPGSRPSHHSASTSPASFAAKASYTAVLDQDPIRAHAGLAGVADISRPSHPQPRRRGRRRRRR